MPAHCCQGTSLNSIPVDSLSHSPQASTAGGYENGRSALTGKSEGEWWSADRAQRPHRSCLRSGILLTAEDRSSVCLGGGQPRGGSLAVELGDA